MKGKALVIAKLKQTPNNAFPYQPPESSLLDPPHIFLMIERWQEKGGSDCLYRNFVFQSSLGVFLLVRRFVNHGPCPCSFCFNLGFTRKFSRNLPWRKCNMNRKTALLVSRQVKKTVALCSS